MKTFSINTLGCKVNQYESQQIRQLFEGFGLIAISLRQKPDIIVINTCCVTHTASAKSRQSARKALRQNPASAVIICGCLSTVEIGELGLEDKKIHIVKNKECLPDVVAELTGLEKTAADWQTTPISSFTGQNRAFLKVQDGCDGYCTYCIIPKTRPVIRSKDPETVVAEARALVEAGHREIVLTGIFLGAYGQKTVRRKRWESAKNDKLADLLEKIAKIPNLARIRLSSLEPADVTSRLLEVICKYPNIAPHLHLSLQSGSPNILKKMCRQYTVEDFEKIVEKIKSQLAVPAITTDIIVGFPGETDSDFQRSVTLAKEVKFAKIHVFSFSPRTFTAAVEMQPKVDSKIIKERSDILQKLDKKLQHKFRQKFIGKEVTVITEQTGRTCVGRCERYFMVSVEADKKIAPSQVIKVKLTENIDDMAKGILI